MSKILVVDDDPSIVELLRMMLSEAGHEVLDSGDAVEAVALAARERPDLITLDVRMPVVDGVELRRLLRASAPTAETPILFITGGDPGDVLSRIPADARVGFIDKPIDMILLARKVAELLAAPAKP